MTFDDTDLEALLRLIDGTAAREIDCDELLARVGGYLEVVARGDEPPAGFADVVQHLRQCRECSEEVDALLAVMKARE